MEKQTAKAEQGTRTAVQMHPVKSSFIISIGYNEQTHDCFVQMGPNLYKYLGVKSVTVTRWIKSPSAGHYYHRNIRGQYASERL